MKAALFKAACFCRGALPRAAYHRAPVGYLWRGSQRTLATASGISEAKPLAFSEMPAEYGWPVVGVTPRMWRSMDKMGEDSIYQQLQRKHGAIYKMRMSSFGASNWLVVVSTPEAVEGLFRAEGKLPRRGFEDNIIWIHENNNIPSDMLVSVGEEWRKLRSGASRQVIPRRVGNYTSTMCELASDFADHLVAVRNDDCIVSSIHDELHKFTFRGICYFVFNEKLDILGRKNQHHEFLESSVKYTQAIGDIVKALPTYKIYPTKPYKFYLEATHGIHLKGKEFLKKRFERIKATIASGTVDETKAVGMLDQWLIEGKFTEDEVISLSCEMLSAGIDTTTCSLTFLHEVAKHPEVQEKLLHEIKAVLGDKTTATYEDLQKMALVRNCVKETLS